MAGKALPGKGAKSMPPKQHACCPPGSASLTDTAYPLHASGVSMSACSVPLTYDALASSSSVVGQAGSGLSSSLSQMPSQKMLHGYGPSAAQSTATDNRNSSAKRSGTRPSHAALAGSASYQAFEHSTGHQPLTSSVLALHVPSQPQQAAKLQRHTRQQKPQKPPHPQNGPAKPTHPSAAHPTSSALSLGTGGPSPSKYHLRHTKSKSKPDPLAPPNATSSALETAMTSAGASGMTCSTYDLRRASKPSQTKASTHGVPGASRPPNRNTLLTQSQPHITTSQMSLPAAYAMPEPIHQSFSAPFPQRQQQQQQPAYVPHQPDSDYTSSWSGYNGDPVPSGQPPRAQSFPTGSWQPPQPSTQQQQWSSQPSSYTMPGPF
ncbi:hypothetical protein H4R20_005717, partial [Coemansia guatemalensis]